MNVKIANDTSNKASAEPEARTCRLRDSSTKISGGFELLARLPRKNFDDFGHTKFFRCTHIAVLYASNTVFGASKAYFYAIFMKNS